MSIVSTVIALCVAFYALKLELNAGYYECKNCHEKKTETLNKTGHSYIEISRTPATTTTEGTIVYKCMCVCVFFFRFVSIIGYYKIFSIVPCIIQ